MAIYYTGYPQNSKARLYRLGLELKQRRTRPWEHPSFGGVNTRYHMAGSKHSLGRAIDNNRFFGQADEDRQFDRFAIEFMARGWGVIWNRRRVINGKSVIDHTGHLHVETIAWRSENYDQRVRLKRARWRPYLAVDGIVGPKTITALQQSLGTYVDGKWSWGGQAARALQAYLNTELNAGLILDGKFGRRSQQALSRYLGLPITNHGYITSRQWRVLQGRLRAHGHIGRPGPQG